MTSLMITIKQLHTGNLCALRWLVKKYHILHHRLVGHHESAHKSIFWTFLASFLTIQLDELDLRCWRPQSLQKSGNNHGGKTVAECFCRPAGKWIYQLDLQHHEQENEGKLLQRFMITVNCFLQLFHSNNTNDTLFPSVSTKSPTKGSVGSWLIVWVLIPNQHHQPFFQPSASPQEAGKTGRDKDFSPQLVETKKE